MISFKHNVLFIHIPKCGGQSIETAFLNDLGLKFNQRACLLLRARVEQELSPPRLAHLKAVDYVNGHYLSQELYDSLIKFVLVRNPYKRVVSFYKYLKKFNTMTLSEFIQNELLPCKENDNMFHFFRPQVDYIKNNKEQVMVDHIIKLEELNDIWPDFLKKLSLKTKELPHVNKSEKGNFILTDEDKLIIQKIYKSDFLEFNYQM